MNYITIENKNILTGNDFSKSNSVKFSKKCHFFVYKAISECDSSKYSFLGVLIVQNINIKFWVKNSLYIITVIYGSGTTSANWVYISFIFTKHRNFCVSIIELSKIKNLVQSI